nr:tail fiber domain-containing protein [uncultured Draconibacterium sp.]
MKNYTISILIFLLVTASSTKTNAQALKVRQDGTVVINGDRPADDANGEVAAIVYGTYGTMLTNGRLAIGDYGRIAMHGGNVFLGEYGTNIDSDIMQLHGKKGIYLTRDYGEVVGYYKYSNNNRFTFNCSILANSFTVTSDKRLKTNIKKLDSSLALLKKVDGVSYNLLPKKDKITTLNAEGQASEKEKKSQEEYKKQKAKYEAALAEKTRIGFVAQDLQKVFPELVEEDSSGFLSVDYIGIIPVLVEAIKELEARIETLENDCCAKNGDTKSASITGIEINDNISAAKLYQNSPNPFSSQTTIKFEIPQQATSAQLHIFNMTGTLLKTINIYQKGNGSETIYGNEFKAGMYLYSLMVDGNIVDTKRMLLTQ